MCAQWRTFVCQRLPRVLSGVRVRRAAETRSLAARACAQGGQYAIYLSQALQAAGRKKEAAGLLEKCESHPDADVRKIAGSVLYVLRAPELKLDAEQFVSIAPLGADSWAAGRQVRKQEEPPPEKYSLEWYVLEAEKRKGRDVAADAAPGAAPALAVSAAMLALAFAALLVR